MVQVVPFHISIVIHCVMLEVIEEYRNSFRLRMSHISTSLHSPQLFLCVLEMSPTRLKPSPILVPCVLPWLMSVVSLFGGRLQLLDVGCWLLD